ncbi:MAG: hypothetical protein UX26_C0030G0005 [Parcubacteria group bacterium GW2011_GWC1_45_9]|nr:MAG: hypothetical protein UW89_C0018G0013 [Parcubacteria group bacterium GW2011_GWB1_45_10]KKU16236.1 MAG: hypothetical protein UX26_C0030G0005 [Parcubacteria group bacterium GW2011_GWC1_45_9]HCI05168.1 hypothetical protein [Patescibacteria group bacterium]
MNKSTKLILAFIFSVVLLTAGFVFFQFSDKGGFSGCFGSVQAAILNSCPFRRSSSGTKKLPLVQPSPAQKPELNSFFVKSDKKSLLLTGKNLAKVEIFAKTNNLERFWGEAKLVQTKDNVQNWSFDLPTSPILVQEIFAKAEAKDFRGEFLFMSFPVTGFEPVYQLLWAQKDKSVFSLELNQPKKLFTNQTAILSTGELALTFKQITEDSRCPLGAYCIQAGKVSAKFNLDFSRQLPQEIILSLDPNDQATSFFETDDYKISLVSAGPEKQLGAIAIDSIDYYAIVLVNKK